MAYTCDPDLELNGQTTCALLENINRDVMRPFLAEHGLTEVDPDRWYSAQAVLNVMNDLATNGDSMSDFVAIGIKAAEISPLTPEMEQMPFDAFMSIYAQVYPARHRNGDAGWLRVDRNGDGHLTITMNVIYPDDVMYGLFYGFARRLFPVDVPFTVYYDETVTHRDQGGTQTVIHVAWG